jgi:23S rRNA A1618 N6-methylase RlmF
MMEVDPETAEKLWVELAKERAHLDAECKEDKVEQEATWCQEAVRSVLNAMARKIRICGKSNQWLNAVISQRRKAVGRDKRRSRNSEDVFWSKAELQQ